MYIATRPIAFHVIVAMSIASALPALGQPRQLHFEQITTRDGLESNRVLAILQDRLGFMWFGTDAGLHRYDGYTIETYLHDEESHFCNDVVRTMHEDRAGVLWLGTCRGLAEFDRVSGSFYHYRHEPDDPESLSWDLVEDIHEDREGHLWIATPAGLDRFDKTTGTFKHFDCDPADERTVCGGLVSIAEDAEGRLWFGADAGGGVSLFDPTTETFTRIPVQGETYHPEIFSLIDRLETTNRRLAALLRVGDLEARSQTITVTRRTSALIVAQSEGMAGVEDRRLVDRSGNTVWSMRYDQSVHAGGHKKNRLQVGLLDLDPGTYTMRYETDESHSFGTWNSVPPANQDRWGVQLLELDRKDVEIVRRSLSRRVQPNAISGRVNHVFFDRSDIMWVGTEFGVDRFDHKTRLFTHFGTDPDGDARWGVGMVTGIVEDREGNLWIGNDWAGVDGKTTLRRYDPERKVLTSLNGPGQTTEIFPGSDVNDIFVDRSGMVWIATAGQGVYRVDPEGVRFSSYRFEPGDPLSLSHEVVYVAMVANDGSLWIGTGNGLDVLDRDRKSLTRYQNEPGNPNTLLAGSVMALLEDHLGAIWIGTDGGLTRFQRQTGIFERYQYEESDPTTLRGDLVTTLLEDRRGNVWVGTSSPDGRSGLNRFDRSTNRFYRYLASAADSTSVTSPFIRDLVEDRAGRLWIATEAPSEGLVMYRPGSDDFKRYGVPFASVLELDRRGFIWIGGGGAVGRFDPETASLEPMSYKYGISRVVPNGIVIDESGAIWISTTRKGLVRLDPTTERARFYDRTDGISIRFTGSGHRDPDGNIYLPSEDGLVTFHPDRMRDNPYIPPVVLTHLSVNEQPVLSERSEILDDHISFARTARLSWTQNNFVFTFAALNYRSPEKNRYAYKLEGFDDAWIDGGTNRHARYTNIPPGAYTFRVRGSNDDGVWNEDGASVRIVVQPPFWLTWWFRLISASLLFAAVAAAYRYRVAQLLRVERMRLRIASDLHDDIGSKLSSIALMSDMVRDEAALDEAHAEGLSEIGSVARQSVDDLRDIVWFINPEHERPGDLLIKMEETAANFLNGVDWTFDTKGTSQIHFPMDVRRNLFLLFKEALHNIVEHAGAERVSVDISEEDGRLFLRISDDGVGFVPETVAHGHGLRSMRLRAEEMGGELRITSEPGEGTSVTLMLPI